MASDAAAMTEAAEAAEAAEIELHALDAALERARRRLYAVEYGLEAVADREAEVAARQAEYAALGERFREAYRRWQRATRAEAEAAGERP